MHDIEIEVVHVLAACQVGQFNVVISLGRHDCRFSPISSSMDTVVPLRAISEKPKVSYRRVASPLSRLTSSRTALIPSRRALLRQRSSSAGAMPLPMNSLATLTLVMKPVRVAASFMYAATSPISALPDHASKVLARVLIFVEYSSISTLQLRFGVKPLSHDSRWARMSSLVAAPSRNWI